MYLVSGQRQSPVQHSRNSQHGMQLETSVQNIGMEANVRDNSRALAATLVGAVVGAAAGYLFFTEHGRWLRRQFDPALDDFQRELGHFRGTVNKAAGVASDGWRLLNEALGESSSHPPRYPHHQTSPF